MKAKIKHEKIQDLSMLTAEQNIEIQNKFNVAMREELSKPENLEFLKKWNEDGTKKEIKNML
jgi:ABC-type transport system involved in cytochrome c biogenesis ATPase subunit